MSFIPQSISLYEPKELHILVLSDSHVNGGNLNFLADWLKNYKPSYDAVFFLGNAANMVNRLRKNDFAESETTQQLSSTIEFLRDYTSKPIIYIPGNTEPSGTYVFAIEFPGAINLHKRAMQFDEGLVLIGLGGSIPVKKDEKEVLEGYPYEKEEDFKKDLIGCLESATKTFGPNTSYLLLTHIGPAEANTTEVHLEQATINGGFKGFSEILKNNNVIGNIHGHSVASEGLSRPFGVSTPIINPGGLVNGRFGELTLRRDLIGKWKVAEVQFRSLN